MIISTKVVLELCDDGTFREVERHSYEFSGPVAQAKKGSGVASSVANNQNNFMKFLESNYQSQLPQINDILNSWTAQSQPGSMSPAASATYASDLDRINSVYSGLRANAFSANARRGFGGGAPSGFGQSAINALNQSEGQADTAAFRSAIENTQNLQNAALNARMGLANSQLSGELGSAGSALQGAQTENQIANSNLGTIFGMASSIIPGISGIGNIVKGWQGGNLMNTPTNIATSNLPLPNVPAFQPSSNAGGSEIGSF